MRRYLASLLSVLVSACSSQLVHETPAVAPQHSSDPTPKIAATTETEKAEVPALLECLGKLKKSGHDFDRIVQINFASPVQATVQFTWSGGFHGGVFTLLKENGVWVLHDEAYVM